MHNGALIRGTGGRLSLLALLALVGMLALSGCQGAARLGSAGSAPTVEPGAAGSTGTSSAGAAGSANGTSAAPLHKVVVVGDSLSTGYGSSAKDAWPTLISAAPLDPEDNLDVVNASQNGSGYVTAGENNSTFGTEADQAVTADTELVVFFGSENDMGNSKASIVAAADAAFAAVKAKSPHAVILAVGPTAYTNQPEAARLEVRDAVRQAASAAGVLFVDPIEQGWFLDQVAELVGPDGVHPSVAGQHYLQAQLEKLIEEAVVSKAPAKVTAKRP